MVGILTKNSPEKSYAPHMPGVPSLGLNIDRCITKEYVLSEFKDVFKGIGKLPGVKYHIELKPEAQPVQHPPRTVPKKTKEAYKDELERLCSLGIIEQVAEHTDWINSIVPVAKPDGSI